MCIQIILLLNLCVPIPVDATLEMQLPSVCHHTKRGLEIKPHHSNISRKYSN